MHFAPTTESDRTYIARLNFLTDVFGDEHAAVCAEFERDFEYYVRDWRPEHGGIIAWDGCIPAGGVWLVHGTEERHGYGHVTEGIPELALAVEGRYQGQGIGTALLKQAADLAKDLGAPGISLSVHPDNERAYGLYLKQGFAETGIVREGHPVLLKEF